MNKRLAVFVLAIFLSASFLYATEKSGRGAQTLLPPRHWVYDSLQILEQESAIVQFSDQAPLTIQQIRAMLDEIDYDSLSAAGQTHYDSIIEYFDETKFSAQASILQARVEPAINLEGYIKTNSDAPWIYDRYEKKKFIELPITIGVGDYLSLFADVAIGINKTAMNDSETYLNIPYNKFNFDVNFPHNAYGSAGKMFTDTVGINFRISNMAQSFGRAQTGSVIQSEYLVDATNSSFTIFSPIVQYTIGITQFNTDRYMYSHKLDVRIGKKKKFQISAMEACLPYGSMDLRFFNPMMILHNYTSWLDYKGKGSDVGSYFGLKANWAPIKYLRVFALWSMTQFQLPAELSDDEDDPDNLVPNAMGFQAGAESYIPLGLGHLHLNLEGYYANPYLYINSSPNWSFVRTSAESNSDSDDIYEWLGTRYGPDTIAATLNASYEVKNKWSAGFKYLFLARGELSNPDIFKRIGWTRSLLDVGDSAMAGWVYPYYPTSANHETIGTKYKNGRNASAPSGENPEYVNVITLYGTYNFTDWLKIAMQPSLAIISNSGHQFGQTDISFECVLSLQCALTKINKKNKAGVNSND